MENETRRAEAPAANTGGAASFVPKLALVGGALSLVYLAPLPVWTHVFATSLAALVLLRVLSRDPGRHLAVAFGLLAAAPLLYYAAKLGMGARITSEPFGCACNYCIDDFSIARGAPYTLSLFRHPDGWFAALAPFAFPLAGLIGFPFALFVLRVRRAWMQRVLHATSLVSLAFAAALLVFALVRAQRLPALDSYLPSLPVVAVLPPAQGEPAEVVDRVGKWPATLHIYRDHVDGMVIERSCNVSLGLCEVQIHPRTCQFFFESSTSVTVRRDVRAGFVTLDDGSRRFAFFDGVPTHLTADSVDVSPARSWFAAGGLGMLLAVWLQQRRRRARERLDQLAAARAGFHGEDGWIVPDDAEPPLRAEPALELPVGPVLLLSAAPRRGVYRDGQSPDSVDILPGAREDWMEKARRDVAALDIFSVAAAWIGLAPLLTFVARML